MTPTIHPHSWAQFPMECFLYFSFLSVGHFIAFVVGGVLIAALSWRQRSLIVRRIRSWGLFLVLLLSMGALFNGVWSCSIWGRLYYSTDYVLDFTPFWPITQQVIDMPFGDQRGQLFGVTLIQLNFVWLAFAIGTWGSTFLVYRVTQPRRSDAAPA